MGTDTMYYQTRIKFSTSKENIYKYNKTATKRTDGMQRAVFPKRWQPYYPNLTKYIDNLYNC